ncbi:UvrD-helicase domain-containing protein [Brevibacillus borstelensis]|uniref:UvrD-helicase domain-containing protein n=1 Tax=Brevibacillus borstelensis TaxID=45462 RepID=UPI00287F7B3C|nr:UvrD-helicase domain-containing protein [Brevibacillus borstelensis]WNF06444.1 UvrD-helicase domain-containing protein [Brevibacillus borstelensis]
MSKRTYFSAPLGADFQKVPRAIITEPKTSKDLVSNQERDAFYFRSLEKQGIFLNKSQIQVIRHFQGPLLTLAGAGTGKTSVLVCRTGYLITVRNVDPRNILLVTFSKKAAEEMKERIAQLPGIDKSITENIQARTFHSFFLAILRKHGILQEILGETRQQHIAMKKILREMGLQDSYQAETLFSLLSSYKMQMVGVDRLPEKTEEEIELKQIFSRYEEWKDKNNKIDFDDVLLRAYQLLQQKPSLLHSLQKRFLYVSVDEFQDTNMVQYELIKMIVNPHQNLMIVGDDDQTIYSFNGARNDFILNFDKVFPNAKTITLDINYRSTSSIVGLGNEIIKHNIKRKKKTLKATRKDGITPRYMSPKNSDDEAEKIVSQILREVESGKRRFSDIGILYRSSNNNRAILEQLIQNEIPFIEYGGDESFYDHWIVKPVLDHLRLAINRRDFEAIEGVLPTLYINREQGLQYILEQDSVQKKKWPLIHLLSLQEIKDFQKEKIMERLKCIKTLESMIPIDAIQHIRREFYDQFLETNKRHKLTHHKEIIRETLDELESSAKRFNTIEEFLSFITIVMEKRQEMKQQQKDKQTNAVQLMTIHKSKGLEFPVVFLISASEGNMPHSSVIDVERMEDLYVDFKEILKESSALEEERRLAYVAVTRAQEELFISSPMYYRGKKVELSRFFMSAYPRYEANKRKADNRITKSEGTISPMYAKQETVYAWLCTNGSCNVWQRILSYEEAELKSKNCPVCKAPMEKGSKAILTSR